MHRFFTLWKHMFSGSSERMHWEQMDIHDIHDTQEIFQYDNTFKLHVTLEKCSKWNT